MVFFTFDSGQNILNVCRKKGRNHMNKRLQCLILAVVLLFGSGMSALAASVNEVQKQQTETKNRLNEINKSITAIESKRKEGFS